MDLYLKDKNYLNGEFFVTPGDRCFAITDRVPFFPGLCEEYEIIEKIRKNEDGFFDFSKSLIDIGAEDGNYSMLLDFDKNYCFEPNKTMCCLIYTNMYLKNKVENTEVYNIGLGDKDNDYMIFNGFSEKGSGVYDKIPRDYYGVKIVDKMTLDSFNIRNVGLIKTDTEGFDFLVLKGGIHTIVENDYPPILFECWDVGNLGMTQEYHDKLFSFLKCLGYTIYEHWGDVETHLAIKEK